MSGWRSVADAPRRGPAPWAQPEEDLSAAAVDVIVVTWNGRSHLARCLPALAAQDYPHMRVLVVDNGSTDGTLEWLAEAWPSVRVIALGRNSGFCAANNAGIAATDAPWVALLNNDTVPAPGWLTALVEAASPPRVAAVASRMSFLDRPEVINSTGIALDPTGIAWDRLGGAPDAAGDAPSAVFGASAGAALYRRRALKDVEGLGTHDPARTDASEPRAAVFDERFFMYLEDVDLAWRLRLRGWASVYAPGARVLHAASATAGEGSPFKNRLLARNKVWTVLKNYPSAGLARWGGAVLAYDLASAPYRLLLGGQTAALAGRADAWRGARAMWPSRAQIQAARRSAWPEIRTAMAPFDPPWAVAARYRHLRPVID
jgi:GT2 family glycosyltransferase